MQMVELQYALKLLPWDCKPWPFPTLELTKAELIKILCEALQLDWTDINKR